MQTIKKIILEPEFEYFYIIKEEQNYKLCHSSQKIDYDIKKLIALLTHEECKFLIAESVQDDPILLEKMHKEGLVHDISNYCEQIRKASEKELEELISIIMYTRNFNSYLCYMLSNDWISDNFESEESRTDFIY